MTSPLPTPAESPTEPAATEPSSALPDAPGTTPTLLDAPIVAVTVYPGQARVVRRGRVAVPAGPVPVTLTGLPLALDAESVRVTGRGAATIGGVDIVTAHRATHDESGAEGRLRAEQRALARRRAESRDARAVLDAQLGVLQSLGSHAGRTFAKALAEGDTEPGSLGPVTDYLTERLTAAHAAIRELDDADRVLTDDERRVERQLADLHQQAPDATAVVVDLQVAAAGDVELEVSYLIHGAGWTPRYDIRLDGDRLAVDWFGLVHQRSGEQWPACELRLSTARPSSVVTLPELEPWFLRDRPPMPPPTLRTGPMPRQAPMAAASAYGAARDSSWVGVEADRTGSGEVVPAVAPAPLTAAAAVAEQGVTATTYAAQRPTPIPPDGSDHQVLVASFDLPARLEHVTAPLRSDDVVLRVVATNDTEHTLRPGRAALFHGTEFVGSTQLATWAPREELELALGLDDRIRVERKLVGRSAGKALVGGTRRHELRYRIEVANYGSEPAEITVLDQVPVAASPDIVVRDVVTEPAPQEVTDLGEVRWVVRLAPGASTQLELGFRVDTGKQIVLQGWRE
jgi:uncharacterized protein (TIGR02231 family)